MHSKKYLTAACAALFSGHVFALPADLSQLSLEELMAIEITSVAKRSQRLSEAPAAIHVITADDFQRAGLTKLPEALRLAPGVHVAQIDGNKWSVGMRGMGGRWAGQLLVLMDGRTLYSPLFGGVSWEVQDTLLEDIDRIEVIRGPGGTLWGANAVNGVINIITKQAADTQGGLAYARAGNQGNEAGLRYGAKIDEGLYLRGYAKSTSNDNMPITDRVPYLMGRPIGQSGAEAHDGWDMRRAGFRLDNRLNGRDSLTLQGDVYDGDIGQTSVGVVRNKAGNALLPESVRVGGANLMLHWQRRLEDGALRAQAYVDRVQRTGLLMRNDMEIRDIELQHNFKLGTLQDIVWGVGYRDVASDLLGSNSVMFSQPHGNNRLYNLFLQDEIRLRPDLALTVGSKFEHNDFTGMEPQPNARLFWQLDGRQSLWTAWSHAVRTPSILERSVTLVASNLAPFAPISYKGSPLYGSERLDAYEVGWRKQVRSDLNVDVAAFYYDYDNLRSLEQTAAMPPVFTFDNLFQAKNHGLELSATWQATPDWRLFGSYSHLQIQAKAKNGSKDPISKARIEGSSPKNLFQLHSQARLRPDLDFDAMLYYVGGLQYGAIGDYTRLDLRLTWKPRKRLEFSLVGQNLLDDRHFEFSGTDSAASDVPRSLYAQARLRF